MPYKLYVFGSNGEGQLGIPAAEIVDTPTVAPWPSTEGIKAVRSGDNHTLILSSAGSMYGSGDNQKGQLEFGGIGPPRYTGFQSFGRGIPICAATCQSSACIIEPSGSKSPPRITLMTTGACHWGELGRGYVKTPPGAQGYVSTQVLPHSVIDFAAGGWHYAAVLSNGDVLGWGKSRLDQLGPKLSPLQSVHTTTLLEENIPFRPVKVVCGKEFTYVASDPSLGQHYLMGRDKFSVRSSMPADIKGWKQIGATWHAIFVLFEDGRLTAWGKDNMWKLLPDNLPLIEQLAVGSEHILAMTKDGKVISWGWGKHGNCGDLVNLGDSVKNDMVSGFWNEIPIPGTIKFVGAGFCTSFVLAEVPHTIS